LLIATRVREDLELKFLGVFRRGVPADLSTWHSCPAPLFKTIKLIDGSTPAISDTLMRRKVDGWWEYRALTNEEFLNYRQRIRW
jgi:hypothetical protein